MLQAQWKSPFITDVATKILKFSNEAVRDFQPVLKNKDDLLKVSKNKRGIPDVSPRNAKK